MSYHLFPSGKKYAYIQGASGPVFLRNIVFLTNKTDRTTIAIVHEWGKGQTRWEPPKGQMEWKEFDDLAIAPNTKLPLDQLYTQMRKGILREMQEESYILPKEIRNFRRLQMFYEQDWPESKIKGAKFMYQYWTAQIDEPTMRSAQTRIRNLVKDPDWKLLLPADFTEKDAIEWFHPEKGFQKIRTGFSQKMTRLYYDSL